MQLHHIVSFSTAFTAVVLNCITMFIIMNFSSDKIGRYKYLLFSYVLNAACYSFTQFFILVNWVVPDGGYIFLSTITFVPKWVQTWCITIWVAFFDINLFIVCWSFWYRLSCVVGSSLKGRPKRIIFYVFLCFLLLLFLAANIVSLHPTPRTDVFFKDLIERTTNHTIEEVGYIGGPFSYNENEFNWILCTALLVHGIFNNCVISFIVYCWYTIRRHINEIESLAQKRFQYRIYILLTAQTVLPIIFNSSPVIVAFLLSVLHWNIGNWMLVAGMVISFAQMIDPLCIIFIVSDYRRAILEYFGISSTVQTVNSLQTTTVQ